MFAFFHWLVLSIAVRLPRVLPAHVAQQLLVRFGAAVPRDDWRNYSVSEVRWQHPAGWVVEMHAWNYGCRQMAGCNETNPALAYLWRCVSPFEVCVAEFVDAVDSTYGYDMRVQDAAEQARRIAEQARQDDEFSQHEAAIYEAEAEQAAIDAEREKQEATWAEQEAEWDKEEAAWAEQARMRNCISWDRRYR